MSAPSPLRDQLKALEHLQEIDLKIDQLNKNRSELPVALKALDDGLARMQATINVKKAAITEIEKGQRQTQAAIELNNDRLSRSGAKLEGVQNTNEYQAASRELEQLRKMSITLEDQVKKSVAELQTANAALNELNAQFDKSKQERDAKASELAGLESGLQGEIQKFNQERGAFTPKVEPRILAQYNRVRGARAGIGIVPAVSGRCKGCNMMLPPQQYIELQRGSTLHQCPSCNRLLFVPAQG